MFRRVVLALSRDPFPSARCVPSQIESTDDEEDLLLAGYAAPMGQPDLNVPHLQMYPDLGEHGKNGATGKESKFYTFIHRSRSASRPVLAAARRSHSAEPVPVVSPATPHDRNSHARHISLDDDNDHHRDDPQHDVPTISPARRPSKPSRRSPSRPLSASTSVATNTTVTDHHKTLQRPRRLEGLSIPPPTFMPDVHDLTSPVASPQRRLADARAAPRSHDTPTQSRTKSPNPFTKLLRGLSSPRKSSAPLPHSRSGSPIPISNPPTRSQSPTVGVYSVPGSPRKERGRSQTCWRFFSASNSGSASGPTLHASTSSGNPGKRPAASGEKPVGHGRSGPDLFDVKADSRPKKKASVAVVSPHPMPTRAVTSPTHGRGYNGPAPTRAYTSPQQMGNANAAERDSIGTEKLGRCSPLVLGFGGKGRSKERKEKAAKLDIRVVGEPILRDLPRDKNVARATVGIGRPYTAGASTNGNGYTARVKRSSGESGSKTGHVDPKTARRLKHGSFDFERPASGSSAGGKSLDRRPTARKERERALEGHRNARVVDASVTSANANSRKHAQQIQFKSLSDTEDTVAPLPLKRRGTGTSTASHARSRGHGCNQSQMSVLPSGGSTDGREGGGSWGRNHHPPARSALQHRYRQLGAFEFEPAVPFAPPASPKNDAFPPQNGGAPLSNKTPKVNLVPSSPLIDDASSHSAPSTKAKSFDLGLGLAWAPSKIKEDAIFPHSHGMCIIRNKEREQLFMEVRAAVGEPGLQRIEKYIRRFEAGQIPLDGSSGLITRVKKILDSGPSSLSGSRTDDRVKRALTDRLVRVVEVSSAVVT
ncbi:hypothetical protein NEOLEDRAFT_1145059 [Neolentinus lepideus HHB14362 ss-1]|uniref:Uncharacterized protein n=1 Tax=Neolentinus lepideus HHB14362 ss-1 TaxID=1314782 RepID=A0A165V7K8_9AGAM|nr:hypothetical protein NEOLEDRAFT_1145059 [Neolentinus lepideus HHB14362 ss-1]